MTVVHVKLMYGLRKSFQNFKKTHHNTCYFGRQDSVVSTAMVSYTITYNIDGIKS